MQSPISTSLCHPIHHPLTWTSSGIRKFRPQLHFQLGISRRALRIRPNATDEINTQQQPPPPIELENKKKEVGMKADEAVGAVTSTSVQSPVAIDGKELKKAVQKTAATFAPRASTASKNPAVPGTTLYSVFEIQAYASMLIGGALSFNLIFPSDGPDLWRLMGMWSIWMFTIPSLRARDCSKKEKEALNYLFILVPLINVLIPFFWKSFAVVWSADTVAFFAMYAWKLEWLQREE